MSEQCDRARRLIDRDLVEGITAEERAWLVAHVDECAACSAASAYATKAITAVRGFAVQVPADLAVRTRFRVELRARELGRESHGWALWASFGLSWALGIYMAPAIWRGCEWIRQSLGAPAIGTALAFGLWWAAPAAAAGAIWLFERTRVEEE